MLQNPPSRAKPTADPNAFHHAQRRGGQIGLLGHRIRRRLIYRPEPATVPDSRVGPKATVATQSCPSPSATLIDSQLRLGPSEVYSSGFARIAWRFIRARFARFEWQWATMVIRGHVTTTPRLALRCSRCSRIDYKTAYTPTLSP